MTKYFQTWAPKTRKLLVATNLYIDKSKQGAKLLIDHPMQVNLKRKLHTSELKSCKQPRKVVAIKNVISNISLIPSNAKTIVTNLLTSGQQMAIEVDIVLSATEVESKIYKPSGYNEVIADPIHGCQ